MDRVYVVNRDGKRSIAFLIEGVAHEIPLSEAILLRDALSASIKDASQPADPAETSQLCQYDGDMVKCPFLTEGGG